jgi:hypothetical protein
MRLARLALCATAALLVTCHHDDGPCEGGCPRVPGCESDSSVTCDPPHICLERVCEGVSWICGFEENLQGDGKVRRYGWYRSSAPCSDGDACTTGDVCVHGGCYGQPMDCSHAPANVCLDASRLKAYQASGACHAGTCEYVSQEIACSQGCQQDRCVGDPCLGVSCKRPHASGAVCVEGKCQGFVCDQGFGDCNSDWADGCEIPIGVPNVCSEAGLRGPAPCGTAYCGAKTGTNIKSFSTWHCVWCSQCHHFSNGWSWCLGTANSGGDGNFSDQRCAGCGCSSANADLVCK